MTDIPGATSSTYTLVSADLGEQISVRVTATNAVGSASASSDLTGPVTAPPAAPSNSGALPIVSGTTEVGQTLTTTTGGWTGTATITYAYQWKRGSTNVGTSVNNYTLVTADIGAMITVVVTATNGVGSNSATSAGRGPVTAAGVTAGWNALKLGTGGIATNFDIHSDGTMVCGTDSSGAFLWNAGLDRWVQLNTTTAHAATGVDLQGGGGVDDIRIDPQNSNTFWMSFDGELFKTTDRGATWVLCSNMPVQPMKANMKGPTKAMGPYIAIDPNQSNVVYVSTPSHGLYRTIDGGATFAAVTDVKAALTGYINNIPSPPSPGTNGTDSITVGTGVAKNFANNSGSFGFSVGAAYKVKVWRTSDPKIQMIGPVTASSGTTFSITPTDAWGTGSYTDWTVSYVQADGSENWIGGGHRVAFNTSGGTTTVSSQTRTAKIYAHTYGIGTYESTDGGVTWSFIAGPTAIRRMMCDPFGVLWCADDMYTAYSNVSKYDAGWTVDTTGTSAAQRWYTAVAIDPTHVASKATVRVCYIVGGTLNVARSDTGGATWLALDAGGVGNRTFVSPSNDVEWLRDWYEHMDSFFANCDAKFDPNVSNKLWSASEGMWYMSPPSTGTALTLSQQSRGMEQFISNNVLSPAGSGSGSVIVGNWDFPCFYTNDLSLYPPELSGTEGHDADDAHMRGYSFDYAWDDPSVIVGIIQSGDAHTSGGHDVSGISTSGGAPGTWSEFTGTATKPVRTEGAHIAAASTTTFVWAPGSSSNPSDPNNIPKETTNSGATWANISIPGGTPTYGWGPVANSSTNCKFIDSDKTNGDIYLWNWSDAVNSIFKRTASTGLWSVARAPTGFTGERIFNGKIKCVFGKQGHGFFTGGFGPPPHPQPGRPLYFTDDGWVTHNTVPNFTECNDVCAGAAMDGHTYPAIYVAGWKSSVFGVYRCADWDPNDVTAGTWELLGENYPSNLIQTVSFMDADKTIEGRVYVTSTASGSFYGSFT